uniref:Uncharacterized protein n=1 Tax=candidate division CPR3 bacterium TaxID=2268181 RepID=A0A7C4QXK0_UNCC3
MKVSLMPVGDIDTVVKDAGVAIHENISNLNVIDEKTGGIILFITASGRDIVIQSKKKLIRLVVHDSERPSQTDIILR